MHIAANLRQIRTERGYSQSDIAEVLDTTQQQYSKYEKGIHELPTRHILTLCDFYNISADKLLGISKKATKPAQESINALRELKYIDTLNFSSYNEFLKLILRNNKFLSIKENLGMHIVYLLICEKTGEKIDEQYYLQLCEEDMQFFEEE